MSDERLVVQNVSKTYATRAESLAVLRDVSFELRPGENLAILGPSGCGKSTLLHLLGALDAPTAGTITLAGQNPHALDEAKLAQFRNRQIGFVFQDHHLLPQCSALENVLLPLVATGRASAEDAQRARRLLERVGLGERLDHWPAELSGGERQRVAIARALVNSPRLLLADEPTGNLDQASAALVGRMLIEAEEEHRVMLVLVTHSAELAALLGRRMRLEEGRLEPCP